MVQTCVLVEYLEYDRRKTPLPQRSKRYIEDLGDIIKQNGLKNPTIFAISEKTDIYIYIYIYIYISGSLNSSVLSQRLIIYIYICIYIYIWGKSLYSLLDYYVDWKPLMANDFFLNSDEDNRLCPVPRTVYGNWPSNPKPHNFGFETRPI